MVVDIDCRCAEDHLPVPFWRRSSTYISDTHFGFRLVEARPCVSLLGQRSLCRSYSIVGIANRRTAACRSDPCSTERSLPCHLPACASRLRPFWPDSPSLHVLDLARDIFALPSCGAAIRAIGALLRRRRPQALALLRRSMLFLDDAKREFAEVLSVRSASADRRLDATASRRARRRPAAPTKLRQIMALDLPANRHPGPDLSFSIHARSPRRQGDVQPVYVHVTGYRSAKTNLKVLHDVLTLRDS